MYRRTLAYADRGKQIWRNDINQNDPSTALFPALNFNTDEISCAIGLASLNRLQETINARVAFGQCLSDHLKDASAVCRPYAFHKGFSPFFLPIFVDLQKINCSKIEFARAVAAEGIDLNLHYGCVISSWPWARPYLSDDFVTHNALSMRDRSFNLFLNESYADTEAVDIVSAIVKVERHYLRARTKNIQ
jgi:dTDP-4-amino-4,6-dideoxygalactose transaminase